MRLKIYIISTGTELTLGKSVDTNSAWIANELSELGFYPNRLIVLPDKPDLIKAEIQRIMGEPGEKLILMTGGLGATADDHTLNVICEITKKDTVTHEKAYEKLLYISEQRGKAYQDLLPVSVRQTKVPVQSLVLDNEVGLAPGFCLTLNDETQLAAFPGVPREMKPMFQNEFLKFFRKNYETKEHTLFSRWVWGVGEGIFQETFIKNNPELFQKTDIEWGVTAKAGYIQASFRSEDTYKLKKVKELLYKTFENSVTENVFQEVHDLLIDHQATVSTAESCTGGLVGKLFTDIPGSSSYYMGSVVAYHNRIKMNQLGVPANILHQYGAVSEETAKAMVSGIQEKFDTNYAISVTGIAGPSGGTKEKKVGLVYIGVKSNFGEPEIYRYDLNFNRDLFREYVANTAVFLLYNRLRKDFFRV
jgi:nicotinamide-nucleotide amidase